ncbi:hypothetical protein ACHAWF_008106 [Thalassiosira exigua]
MFEAFKIPTPATYLLLERKRRAGLGPQGPYRGWHATLNLDSYDHGTMGGSILASCNLTGARAKLQLTKTIIDEPCTCENGKAKIWGPGGPHTALIPVADLFNSRTNKSDEKDNTQIEICYGPESTWRSEALRCASGLMTAAEQQTAGFARVYADIIDASGGYGSIGTPLRLHKTVILVPAGNPKGISGLDDLVHRDDVGMVIVDGNYHGTLTSGTALWEDVIGRSARLDDTVDLRAKVCYVASGTGDARNQLIESENQALLKRSIYLLTWRSSVV